MKVNVEQLSTDAAERLEDACVVDGLARHLPEAVLPEPSAWGTTEPGRSLAERWHTIWETYRTDLSTLRDRLSGKASHLAQTAADYARTEIEVTAPIASLDEDGPGPATDAYLVTPGGDGFTPDYRNGRTAGNVVAQLTPQPHASSPGRADLEGFTIDNLTLLEEAELLLKRHYGDDLGFRQPTGYLWDLTSTDPQEIASRIELTAVATSQLEAIRDRLDAHMASLPEHWESDAAVAYLDFTDDSRTQVSALGGSLADAREKGLAAAELLDDLLARSVRSATSPRADGQSHIQRIRQAVERIQDMDADIRSYDSRAGWETVDPGADQELLDIAYRGLWQRARGLAHTWSQCVDEANDDAGAIWMGDVSPRVTSPPATEPGSDTPGPRLDMVPDTEKENTHSTDPLHYE